MVMTSTRGWHFQTGRYAWTIAGREDEIRESTCEKWQAAGTRMHRSYCLFSHGEGEADYNRYLRRLIDCPVQQGSSRGGRGHVPKFNSHMKPLKGEKKLARRVCLSPQVVHPVD